MGFKSAPLRKYTTPLTAGLGEKQHLKIAIQELRPPHSETPIRLLVLEASHDQVVPVEATLLLQALSQFGVESLLDFGATTLLEDLDEHQLVRSFDAEVRVFADELVGFMLRYDLYGVRWWLGHEQSMNYMTKDGLTADTRRSVL